jgi:transcriptional regulator with GAF, ATPase, and Fis domain
MEGEAVRDAGLDCQSDLHKGKTGAIAFDLAESLECERPSESEDHLARQNISLEDEVVVERDFRGIVGNNTSLKVVLDNVRIVAPADSSVLILGETGTGKELIARAIHDLSPRKNYPFVKVNCAGIPSGLLESELFGHERGAFTGAIAQKIGRFELGDKGTLFLDEVGDIRLELQPKLLRVLQEQEFERLGSTRTQRVDVRVVAATNADLATLVGEKKFRSDLYYRLNVFPISVPPLRERHDDIARLVCHFATKYAQSFILSLQFDKELNASAESECTTRQVALSLRSPQEPPLGVADEVAVAGKVDGDPDVGPWCPTRFVGATAVAAVDHIEAVYSRLDLRIGGGGNSHARDGGRQRKAEN